MRRIGWTAPIAAGLLAASMAGPAQAASETDAAGPVSPERALIESGRSAPFEGMTTEQKIQELADRAEIHELIAIYAHRAALGVDLADLFTDDGAFIINMPGQPAMVSRGREALDETYAEIARNPGASLPMIHNIVLEIDGDEALGLCSIELRGNRSGQNMVASGYYEDSFRREDDRWKFVKREVRFHHFTTLEKGWAN